MNEIVVVGGGGHAKVVISILKRIKNYNIIGYTDIVNKKDILDIGYLGNDGVLEEIKSKYNDCSAVIGIGILSLSDINKRIKIRQRLEALGYKFPTIISPNAVINEGVEIAKGTVIFDGVIVNSGSTIGECVIINTNSSIDHDCHIGDNVHIAPGVTLSGGVIIGNKSFIGVGATIVHYKKIGENCMVGAGALVINDSLESGKYLGTPAKRII